MTARLCQQQFIMSYGVAVLSIVLVGCASCGSSHHDSITPKQHSVSLSWDASSTSNVQYNVYRGAQHLGPYSVKLNSAPLSSTSFTDSTVHNGTTYYYVVTAVDGDSVESDYSNEATVGIPSS